MKRIAIIKAEDRMIEQGLEQDLERQSIVEEPKLKKDDMVLGIK